MADRSPASGAYSSGLQSCEAHVLVPGTMCPMHYTPWPCRVVTARQFPPFSIFDTRFTHHCALYLMFDMQDWDQHRPALPSPRYILLVSQLHLPSFVSPAASAILDSEESSAGRRLMT